MALTPSRQSAFSHRFRLAIVGSMVIGGCSIGTSVPPFAQVFADDATKQYISPPCLLDHPEWAQRFSRETKMAEMDSAWRAGTKAARYWPNDDCVNEEGFIEKNQLWPLPKPESRVRPDGTWKW